MESEEEGGLRIVLRFLDLMILDIDIFKKDWIYERRSKFGSRVER